MKKIPFLLILFSLLDFTLQAQQNQLPNLEKLDAYFEQMVRDWDVPGASIGIVKDGELVFRGNYGLMEKGGSEQPDANTLYAVASNSKAFTSALIGMLVQEGKLDWNDKVQKHLPYFSLYDDPWISSQVTIRDLLSHRVGLGTFSGDVIWYKSEADAEELIKRAGKLPQAYGFRAGYGYSNLMYITAGEVIRKVTGKSWGENVQERILHPLGMDRTLTTIKGLEKTGNYATPHGRIDGENFAISYVDWENVGATGGIISSVEDMAKWMVFNLNHGIIDQDTLLSKSTRNMVWTMHNVHPVDRTSTNSMRRNFSGYGLGWTMGDYNGNFMVGHTGGYDGMISAVTLIPDEKLGVVVLTNGQKSPIMAATLYALDRFLETGDNDWSAELLEYATRREENDTRIADLKAKKVDGTQPSKELEEYAGTYYSEIYGDIQVAMEGNDLRLIFSNSPDLSATLRHWHYDTFEIDWDEQHAWFSFGTVKFTTDNNMEVTGMDFEVPNDDFFFEELKPKKAE